MANSSKVRKFRHIFALPPATSAVSPEIQASLLQVGMRVRKSVGQGYRTQLALEEAKMRSERANNATRGAQSMAYEGSGISVMVDDEPLQDDAFFPSSQDSVASTLSSGSATSTETSQITLSRKRLHGVDDEDEDEDELSLQKNMEAISTCLRPIAQAKSRKPLVQKRTSDDGGTKPSDQLGDFGEADFLLAINQEKGKFGYSNLSFGF